MRLATLKPRLTASVPVRLAAAPAHPQVTARVRGRAGVERRARWLLANPLCIDCEAGGRVTAAAEVDHVVPLWRGGADDETNFASRCCPCHAAKTKREAAERAAG